MADKRRAVEGLPKRFGCIMLSGSFLEVNDMALALTESEIKQRLAELKDWSRDGDVLVKSFQFDSYLAGLAFASTVGVIAEGLSHHPDMNIGWRRVTVSFTTHDAGNKLSAKDFAAAKAIDAVGFPS